MACVCERDSRTSTRLTMIVYREMCAGCITVHCAVPAHADGCYGMHVGCAVMMRANVHAWDACTFLMHVLNEFREKVENVFEMFLESYISAK